jgi:GNAT superfamily N-acetyltransferase
MDVQRLKSIVKALIEAKVKERIPGGLASGISPSEFDPESLKEGTKVEMEHTSDPEIAQEISEDHLMEDPKYYEKLKELELSELEKGIHGDWKAEGYKLRYHGNNRFYHVIQAFKGRKKVGHVAYSREPTRNPREPSFGYHQVPAGYVDEGHKGKGLYQEMLKMASQHAKQLGNKGIASRGFQRSDAATQAWMKLNPKVEQGWAGAAPAEDLLLNEELDKGLKGDWEKEGYSIRHKESVWEPTGTKHLDITVHHPKYGIVAEANFTDKYGDSWYPHNVSVHPSHQRKGIASAMLDHAIKSTGKPLESTVDLSPSGLILSDKYKINKSESLEKEGYDQNKIRDLADQYASSKGIKLQHNLPKVKVNSERATKIAQAYESMPHNPNDPEVKHSYNSLANETMDQFNHLVNSGLKISRIKPGQENPYKTSKDLFHDVHQNGHIWYYPTEQGFGSGKEVKNHPLLANTGITDDGHPLLANDVFRVVHDIYGHAKEGHNFGPNGEENAWRTHMQMYSPSAQKALTSETRSQNSWVNFGKHGEHNRKNPSQTIFADQKAGLMPGIAYEIDGINKSESLEKVQVTPTSFVLEHTDTHPKVPHNETQKKMVHGIDVEKVKNFNTGWTSDNTISGTAKNSNNKKVVIKGDLPKDILSNNSLDSYHKFNTSHREVAFHNMARDFWGLGKHVPTTSLVSQPISNKQHSKIRTFSSDSEYDDGAPVLIPNNMSVQEHIRGAKHYSPTQENDRLLSKLKNNGTLHKMAIMDVISGNTDRHSGNYMLTRNNLHLIDHGLTFDYGDRSLRMPAYLQPTRSHVDRIHPNVREWLLNLKEKDLKRHMKANGIPSHNGKHMLNAFKKAQDMLKYDRTVSFSDLYSELDDLRYS